MTTYLKAGILLSVLAMSQLVLSGCAAVAGGVAGAAVAHHVKKKHRHHDDD